MSDVAIRVHDLGKCYPMSPKAPGEKHDMLAVALGAKAFGAATSLRRGKTKPGEFWALKDVNFEVKRGEVMGLVGRNGAGKSTLLKILSRITEPTTGCAQLHGRVGSLLEVGTGFHPDLTGRENTYLNGAILGMRKAEIDRVFDEIVEFAEIGKFIDMHVKAYSSGMFSRLAFAVAAHLRPEIMLIDEVLSVGDMAFQQKCIGKMEDVTGQGRTVLFVSHDMRSVARLCHRTVLLHQGGVEMIGPTSAVVKRYFLEGRGTSTTRTWPEEYNPRGTEHCRLLSARLVGRDGESRDLFTIDEDILVEIVYRRLSSEASLVTQVRLDTADGTHAFTASNFLDEERTAAGQPPGVYRVSCVIPKNMLNEGMFRVMVALHTYHPFFFVHYKEVDALGFTVTDQGGENSFRHKYNAPLLGIFRPHLHWESHRV